MKVARLLALVIITAAFLSSAPMAEEEYITYVVKEGDTLWAIAKRYVENPFMYPELARLSNIKNPDLIYPGNRVRIVQFID